MKFKILIPACFNSCKTCSGINYNNCSSCYSPMGLTPAGICACPDGMFNNSYQTCASNHFPFASKFHNFINKKTLQVVIKIVKAAIIQTSQIVTLATQTMLSRMVIALVRQTFQILTTEIQIVHVNNEFYKFIKLIHIYLFYYLNLF